jgi:hypothetical protein
VVAHPPCRAWGRFAHMAKPREGERDLAPWAVDQLRQFGGVLEHPLGSRLWPELGLPQPGQRDAWGGWATMICQHWFGHRAEKRTLLYVVGCEPGDAPAPLFLLGGATHVIAQGRQPRPDLGRGRLKKGVPGWRPEVTPREREHTPPALAEWLVDLASNAAR